jgi:hypothetical protein
MTYRAHKRTRIQEDRAEARAKARAAAIEGGWLATVLDHHLAIESAFDEVKLGEDADSRRSAQERLATVLTAHSLAEDMVLYPALALHHENGHATKAYTEHSATKVQMAALEDLDPMSEDYIDKLEHIRGAVAHHVYQEEGNWFLDLNEKADERLHQKLTQRYTEEFERYQRGAEDSGQAAGMGQRPRSAERSRPMTVNSA